MTLKSIKKIFLFGVLLWGSSKPVLAHRLDELLQSSYIMIAPDKVSIELVLTPGATIASGVFQSIDHDHDGKLSGDEKTDYAEKVLNAITLKIDGEEQKLILYDVACSSLEELKEGIGKIRLLASAKTSYPIAAHQLYYMNTFELMMSAYTVNALMPNPKDIEIRRQERDKNQYEIRIDYNQLTETRSFNSIWLVAVGLVVVSSLFVWRKSVSI